MKYLDGWRRLACGPWRLLLLQLILDLPTTTHEAADELLGTEDLTFGREIVSLEKQTAMQLQYVMTL